MIDGFTFANLSPLIVFPNLPFCETVLWGRREPLPPCVIVVQFRKIKKRQWSSLLLSTSSSTRRTLHSLHLRRGQAPPPCQ